MGAPTIFEMGPQGPATGVQCQWLAACWHSGQLLEGSRETQQTCNLMLIALHSQPYTSYIWHTLGTGDPCRHTVASLTSDTA